jgi:hypothetical protein
MTVVKPSGSVACAVANEASPTQTLQTCAVRLIGEDR